MEGGMNELIRYRLERANEMIAAAEDNLKMKQYRTSVNYPHLKEGACTPQGTNFSRSTDC